MFDKFEVLTSWKHSWGLFFLFFGVMDTFSSICQIIALKWKKNHLAFSNIPMQWKRKDPTCLSNPKIWKRKRLALETEALSPSTVLAQSWLKKNGESDNVVFVMLSDMGLRDFRNFSGVKFP